MSHRQSDLDLDGGTGALISARPGASTHAVFPSAQRPRMLLPRRTAAVAAQSVRHYTVPDSWRVRAILALGSALARLGAARLMPGGVVVGGPGSFVDEIGRMLGRDDLIVAVHLGPPRANRKPVLRVMDHGGATVAFAKLGVNALTCARVRHEAQALVKVQGRRPVGVNTPTLIDHGVWRDLDYVLMAPLAAGGAQAPRPELRHRGNAALRAAFPGSVEPVAHCALWARMITTLDGIDAEHADRLRRSAHELSERAGDTAAALGAVHGDWSRWNMGADGERLSVWDWERFVTDGPAGWDELHYVIGSHPRGVAAALADPRGLMRQVYGPSDDARAAVLLAAYLLNRGAAYLADRQFEAGARTGALDAWLLPALDAAVGWAGHKDHKRDTRPGEDTT